MVDSFVVNLFVVAAGNSFTDVSIVVFSTLPKTSGTFRLKATASCRVDFQREMDLIRIAPCDLSMLIIRPSAEAILWSKSLNI